MLVAQNLSLTVADEPHLVEVSFQMERGGLYTILGRTLAGKTTLLKSIAGLVSVDSGTLSNAGTDFAEVPVWRRNVAMVYQQFINYPHFNVFNSDTLPLESDSNGISIHIYYCVSVCSAVRTNVRTHHRQTASIKYHVVKTNDQ